MCMLLNQRYATKEASLFSSRIDFRWQGQLAKQWLGSPLRNNARALRSPADSLARMRGARHGSAVHHTAAPHAQLRSPLMPPLRYCMRRQHTLWEWELLLVMDACV